MVRTSKRLLGLFVFSLGLAGCSGADVSPSASPSPPAPDDGSGSVRAHEHGSVRKDKHEHQFRGDLKLYHDLMSSLWHAELGQERITSTCDAVTTLTEHGAAIARSSPPVGSEGQPHAWTAAAEKLSDRTDALAAACGEVGRQRVEAVFTEVHEAFHDLMVVVGDQRAAGD